jgi:transcriptional regulator with XRE-family HTH domain
VILYIIAQNVPKRNIILVLLRYITLMNRRNIVGSRIRQARKSANPSITQMDLVARLEVQGISIDRSGLSKIETGHRPVTDIEAAGIARALKVSVSWLFGETDDLA